MKLFLDTNVLIDFIMERPLFYDEIGRAHV